MLRIEMVEEGKLFSMAAIVGILLNNLLAAMRQTLLQISRMERKGVIIMTTFLWEGKLQQTNL